MKYIALLFLLGFFQYSEAQTGARCINLFTDQQIGSTPYYAEFLDSLNQQSNEILFNKSVSLKLEPELSKLVFSERIIARYHSYKLRKILKQFKNADSFDSYDFENLALKLERLTILSDPNVVRTLSQKDQILYRQAQHSILAKGLENFLFDVNSKATQTTKRKIFDFVMTPFKDIYMRWSYAYIVMPKLNGAVLPTELAMKVAWSGIEANKEALSFYTKQAQFKNYFNLFSKSYNWILVTAIFAGLPAYTFYIYNDAMIKGQQHFTEMLKPVLKQVNDMATVNYGDMNKQKRFDNFVIQFKDKNQREPTVVEIETVKKMIEESSL